MYWTTLTSGEEEDDDDNKNDDDEELYHDASMFIANIIYMNNYAVIMCIKMCVLCSSYWELNNTNKDGVHFR